MIKRVTRAAVVALVLAGAVSVVAAERATFVLRNGQRESGTLVAHGDQRANLILGFFNLGDMPGGTGNLREKAYPQAQVVAIDFAGGQPPADELSQLNRMDGAPNLLVLRGGRAVRGRFDNIVDGETVVFENQRYAARDVARVYLDVEAVKSIYHVAPDLQAARGEAASDRDVRPGYRDDQRDGPGVQVAARRVWTGTGISVRRGDRLAFRASGRIWTSDGDRGASEADGLPGPRRIRRDYPVPDAPVGALIGRVGNGQPFLIGLDTRPITMADGGPLFLGVNDNVVGDNRGSFRVEVVVLGRGR